MADYAKLNDVTASDIVKINGVAYASVAKCSGLSSPASGASRWVCVTAGGYVVHAANSDRTSWSSYDGTSASPKSLALAFGKNSAGAGLYVAGTDASASELLVSGTDVTAGTWTNISTPTGDQYAVSWGVKSDGATAGVWMSAGQNGSLMRSTDGASTWSAVNMGSTNLGTKDMWGIANNGQGKWAFGAGSAYLFVSTDDGATWSDSEPWGTNTPGKIKGIIYTKNAGGGGSWVIAYSRGGSCHFRSCSDSDLTDWSDEFSVNSTNFPARASNGTGASVTFANPSSQEEFIRMAAFNGKVCAVSTADEVILTLDVDGKTMSNGKFRDGNKSDETGLDLDSGDHCASVATDGNTWLVSCRGGDVFESTDADTWTQVLNDVSPGSSQRNLNAIACDVVLPL